MNPETFTYVISSNDRTNDLDLDDLPTEYFIDFGGFGHHTGKYTCDVVSLMTNGNFHVDLKYVNFIADGLHSGGYYSNRPSYECVLCSVDVGYEQTLNNNATFIIDNCRIKKQVRFAFLSPQYAPLTSPTQINIDTNILDWNLTLKLTPILDN